jgi:mono/diheme cytochrome c family protein
MTLTPFRHSFSQFAKSRAAIVLLVGLSLLLAGCAESGQMADQPRYDPLEPSLFFADGMAARPVPEGSVPFAQNIGQSPLSQEDGDTISPNSPVLTGLDAEGNPVEGFPLPVDQELVMLGQERYTIFCVPCHGPAGEGNGRAVGFGVTKPPSLIDDAGSALTSGTIFDVITAGKGQMFAYGYRVKPEERWAIIAYIRALQLSNGPADPASLTPADLQSIESQP